MVNETRQVVEDYVLYKIHLMNNNNQSFSNGFVSTSNKDLKEPNRLAVLCALQEKPSPLNLAVRSMANQIETKYKQIRPDLFDKIRNIDIASCNVKEMLSQISKLLFPLPIKPVTQQIYQINNTDEIDESNIIQWPHLIGFLVYAGLLAIKAVECESFTTVEEILTEVTTFFDTELSNWLSSKGGWTNFYEWSKGSLGRLDSVDSASCGSCASSGVQAAMRVGVVAACFGIGALIMSKK